MRIAFPDLPVTSMDEQFGSFALGGMPCGVNCGGLGVVMGGIALRAFFPYSPLAVSRNNVYISFHRSNLIKFCPEDLPTKPLYQMRHLSKPIYMFVL